MNQKLEIVAVVVDTQYVTLYTKQGKQYRMSQGDSRIPRIIAQTKDAIIKDGVAMLDYDAMHSQLHMVFKEYEDQSNGLVRFFKVAKSKVQSLLTGSESVIHEAISVHEVGFTKPLEPEKEEIVAVVKTEQGTKVIPAMENLEVQLNGVKNGDVHKQGVDALIQRMAAMVDKRKHSVEDLLTFLKRADLPITNNGDIVIYKVLKENAASKAKHSHVDCHSKLVEQGANVRVFMQDSMVDPNRLQDCSNGLHVASRSYLGMFPGDACFLGVIRPEDVIAVPKSNTNKMRVSAYHLIYQLPQSDYKLVNSNKPFTNGSVGQELLAKVVNGEYPPYSYEVEITGEKGTGCIYTGVTEVTEIVRAEEPVKARPIEEAQFTQAPKVNPLEVAKEVAATKPTAGNKATIQALLAQGELDYTRATEIQAIKVKSKRSYINLGVDAKTEAKIRKLLGLN